MKSQKITRANLFALYAIACESWRTVISRLLIEQQLSDQIEVSNELIEKAHKEADASKKTEIEKYFSIDLPKNIKDRINTKADVLKILNIDESFLPYKNPSTAQEKSINAQAWIFKITQAYNEKWEVDWKSTSQYKYIPYKYFSGGRWLVDVGGWSADRLYASGLYYKSSDLALDAVTKFRDIYDDYWMS